MKNKSIVNFSKLFFLLLFSPFLLASCDNDDDDDNMVQEKSITEIVVDGNDFTLLEAAVVRANLAEALRTGNRTVFAPTDAAFRAAGFADVAAINNTPVATLLSVLQYHVIDGADLEADDIPTAANTSQNTLGGSPIFITKNASGVSVNGAMVTTADVDASNGVVHVINKVLMPPAGTLVDVALANPAFSYLVAAVQRADLASTLSSAGPFTVFAPTNDAFIAAGFATEEDIRAADPAVLANILTYHVIPARVFSTNLTAGNVATVQGGNVAIAVSGAGATVTGTGNGGTASNIVMADVVATNGVVHVINRVLLP